MAEIRVVDLRFSYPPLTGGESPIPVLKGVNLEVEKGELVSIMGPTGVGKTTLCLALNGIVPHSTGGVYGGDVWVCGLNTRVTGVAKLASLVGIVFQDPESQFFNMTVEDEVAFGPESLCLDPREIEERVDWALHVVGMAGLRRRSPFQLSGGQKQRVAIASILAMQPKVLVLDEPTSGLDPMGKMEVFRVVRELKERQGATIVMVEQEAEKIAEFSDRVLVMSDGVVALSGTPQEVFSQADALAEMGLSIPQVAEVAGILSRERQQRYSFVTLPDALAALSRDLGGR